MNRDREPYARALDSLGRVAEMIRVAAHYGALEDKQLDAMCDAVTEMTDEIQGLIAGLRGHGVPARRRRKVSP